jgi:hypothetical protein
MAMSKVSESTAALPPSVREKPPSIPLVSKSKKMDKVEGPDEDKSELITLELLMDSDNSASKYSRQFAIFKDGCPEEWIKRLTTFHEIENLIPLKETANKTRMF